MNRWTGALAAALAGLLATFGPASGQGSGPGISPPRVPDASVIAFADENLLLVQVLVGTEVLADVIEIYQHEGGYLVPLGRLCAILEFPVGVRPAEGQANGWFIAERRIFSLDLPAGEVVVEGVRQALPPGLALAHRDDIYVDVSLFTRWFPVNLNLVYSDLALVVVPREPIPLLERLAREARQLRLAAAARPPRHFPRVEPPWRRVAAPLVDLNLGADHRSASDPRDELNYTLLSQGDAANHSARLFLSGTTRESPSLLRVSAGRTDADGELLGALRATSYSVGDISTAASPLVLTSGFGRGISVSNSPLARPDQFDTQTFLGDAQPGWEVELYRGDELLAFQTVGSDGRYEFVDVPIFFGNNIIRIVAYGPQGQLQQRSYNYLIDSNYLPPGTVNYRLSLDEKSRTLFGVDEDRRPPRHPPGTRAAASVEYGWRSNTTAGAAFGHTPLEDGRFHSYASVSARHSFRGLLASSTFARDFRRGGWAAQVIAHTQARGVVLRAEQSLLSRYVSETERAASLHRTSSSQLNVSGRAERLLPAGLSYRVRAEREGFEENRTVTALQTRLATSLAGLGVNGDWRWQSTSLEGSSQALFDGEFSVRGRYRLTLLRGSLQYRLAPEAEAQALAVSGQRRLSPDLNARADLRRSFAGESLTSFSAGLNRQFESCLASALLSLDSDGGFAAGAQVSFALAREPRSRRWFASRDPAAARGAASLVSFLDADYDGVFDSTEVALHDVAFRADDRRFVGNGTPILMTGIEPHVRTDIRVDESTIEDPLWRSSVEGYSLVSRPGSVMRLDFPIVITKEIEGTVYRRDGEETWPAGRVEVRLLDEEGAVVQVTRSEYDGFYLFERVRPGSYRLAADPGAADTVQVRPEDEVIRGKDLYIVAE